MGYFELYPASPDEIVGIAASMRAGAADVDSTVTNVTAAQDRAEAAVDGDLSFTLAGAPRPVIQLGGDVAESARFAAGAVLLFADAITTFNTAVTQLNSYLPAGSPDVAALEPFKVSYARYRETLDQAATQAAGMLNRGPNAADIATLTSQGLMPSADMYNDPALQSAFDKTGKNFLNAAFPVDDLTPTEVAAWWATLTSAEKLAVMSERSARLGATDGLPAEVRDEANRIALTTRLDDLEVKEADGTLSDADAQELENIRAVAEQLQVTESQIDPITGDPLHAQLLIFEPAAFDGDGRAAIVIGNADTADNVAWTVPGLSSQVNSYMGDQVSRSLNLYNESQRLNGGAASTAVVAWVGYDAPSGGVSWDTAGVITQGDAEAGAEILASDVAALQAARGDHRAHLTVIGHSYGSTTVAIAADHNGMVADDIILIGSPGAGDADNADDLGLSSDHVFVGANSRDPITQLGGGGWVNMSAVTLGNDPAEDDFDATRFQAEATDRGNGITSMGDHSKYFTPDSESLYNMASVINSDYAAVQHAEHRYDPWYDEMQDPEWDREPQPAPR